MCSPNVLKAVYRRVDCLGCNVADYWAARVAPGKMRGYRGFSEPRSIWEPTPEYAVLLTSFCGKQPVWERARRQPVTRRHSLADRLADVWTGNQVRRTQPRHVWRHEPV